MSKEDLQQKECNTRISSPWLAKFLVHFKKYGTRCCEKHTKTNKEKVKMKNNDKK